MPGPASAPDARAGWEPQPLLPGEASKPRRVSPGQPQASARRPLRFSWPPRVGGGICRLLQKVPGNVIHLQINFSASGWVSNKREPPTEPGQPCLQPRGHFR